MQLCYVSCINTWLKYTFPFSGISRVTLTRIKAEARLNDGVFRTPGKGKGSKSGRPLKVNLDDFDKCAIRNKIHSFYAVRKQMPTLRKLTAELKVDINFQGNYVTLGKVINNLGFKYKKLRSKRTLLIERTDIAAWRFRYLRVMQQLREEPPETRKHLVFVDETYVHTSYRPSKCWQSENEPGPSSDISLGERYIVVHAGTEEGFIPNALLVYKSKDNNADYHHDMNKENFKKWLSSKLIPNLPGPSVIIMDNASYHCTQINKVPTIAKRKDEIKEWLVANGIEFTDDMTKAVLLELVKKHKPIPVYEIDRILEEHGHTIQRLPPYHCDLNSIELIWSLAKRKFAEKNINREKKEIPRLIEEAFTSITSDDWKKECNHVKNVENKYREQDYIIENYLEEFIIKLGDECSSVSDSDCESIRLKSAGEMSGIEFLDSDFDYDL